MSECCPGCDGDHLPNKCDSCEELGAQIAALKEKLKPDVRTVCAYESGLEEGRREGKELFDATIEFFKNGWEGLPLNTYQAYERVIKAVKNMRSAEARGE